MKKLRSYLVLNQGSHEAIKNKFKISKQDLQSWINGIETGLDSGDREFENGDDGEAMRA